MQSGGKDKRINVGSLLQDDVELGDGTISEPPHDDGEEQEYLATLRAKHESLRRQIALLNARLAEMKEMAHPVDLAVFHERRFRGPVIAFSAICATLLAAWSLRKASA